MSDLKRLSLMSVAACAVVSTTAYAQGDGNFYSRDKYEAVRERAQPEFDPEPVRLGAFSVRSAAEVGLTYTDNVYAAPNNKDSGVIGVVGVRASGDTNWSVHGLGFDVAAYRSEYFDQGSESNNDLMARLRGRVDVTRSFSVDGAVFIEDRVEPRTEYYNYDGIDAPLEYTRKGAEIGATYQNDRIRWRNSLGLVDFDYENSRQIGTGLPIDQTYRNRRETEMHSRLSYALTPNLAVYGQAGYSDWEYDHMQMIGGQLRSRDSNGYTVAAGVDFELNTLVRGDIAVGYMNREYDDALFEDVSGLSVDGRLQWFPTQLTTVTFEAGRRAVDTGAYDSPSAVRTSGFVTVDHELRRNIVLSARAGLSQNDYRDIDRNEEDLLFNLGALYKINKRFHVEAFASRNDRDISGSSVIGDPSFDVNTVGLRLFIFP